MIFTPDERFAADEVIRIYLASGLVRVAAEEDVDEISKVEAVPLKQVLDMIMRGEIRDGKTVIGVSVFLAKLGRGEIPADFFGQV